METNRQLASTCLILLSLLCYSNATNDTSICSNATVGSELYCGSDGTGRASELQIVRGDSDGSPGSPKSKVGNIVKWVAISIGVFLVFLALTTMFANMIPILDPCGISGAICDFFKSWFCCSCSASMGCCTIS